MSTGDADTHRPSTDPGTLRPSTDPGTHRVSTGEPETPGAIPAQREPLTEREHEILAFERQWWRHAGSKEQAIRDRFDLSPTRYYQLLNGLLDDERALATDPVLVQRLRRLRATRSRARLSGRD